jgi:hypothetical protein
MNLLSLLFRGDRQLEAAASSDAAHIVPGARGAHVSRIQEALNRLDRAGLDADGQYGARTADAVLNYKKRRNIVNRSYQQVADNIVGRMTIAALDRELLANGELKPLEVTVHGGKHSSDRRLKPAPPVSRFNPARSAAFVDAGAAPAGVTTASFVMPVSRTRHSPGTNGNVRCQQTAGFAAAVCRNLPDPAQDPAKAVANRVVFLSDLNGIKGTPSADPEDGGRVALTKDPHFMLLENLHPGDAMITVSRPDMSRVLIVEVRQDRKGLVPGSALTKFTAGSKFFSASHQEGGEGTDPGGVFFGRPVNPRRGGRLINLGGEMEVPEFEDYQVDLDHSLGGKGGFRPWTDDPDRSVFIPDKSASHITMRNTPLKSLFIKVIKRIAARGCLFTFTGDVSFEAEIAAQIPGRALERTVRDKTIFLAWEIA